jgi:hypothetical protein
MLTISCSQLEKIRNKPDLFGEILAAGENQPTGGTYGMFARWQTMARKLHKKEIAIKDALRELHLECVKAYKHTARNNAKQEFLLQRLSMYSKAYDKAGFEFVSWKQKVNWSITNDVKLTGQTPVLVQRGAKYSAYFIVEAAGDWQKELRFPLLQKYLSEKVLQCKPQDLQMGIYDLSTAMFEFKVFNTTELTGAEIETKAVFNAVYASYRHFKGL